MKTSVSVPDEVFDRAEEAAKRLGLNRSQIYTQALTRVLHELKPDPVTERLDQMAESLSDESGAQRSSTAIRRLIDASGWEW